MDETKVHDLDYYLSLRYRIVLTPEVEGWSATVPDLPGCIAVGDSKAETLEGWQHHLNVACSSQNQTITRTNSPTSL